MGDHPLGKGDPVGIPFVRNTGTPTLKLKFYRQFPITFLTVCPECNYPFLVVSLFLWYSGTMEFLSFFVIQFSQFLIITINMRAVSAGKYRWTAITDALIAGLGFLLIQRVSQAHSVAAWAGYVVGGVIGSQVGIWISKRLWQQNSEK